LETTMPWYVVVSKTTTTRGVFETEIYHTWECGTLSVAWLICAQREPRPRLWVCVYLCVCVCVCV
jgi:hypothetical protein